MRSPSLLIRPAAESDAEAIGRVHFHAWQETYTGLLPGEIMSHLSEERSVGIFRREGCRNIFVAVLEEETVGFCGYGPWRGEAPPPTPGEVVGLYVLQKSQHKGIGAQLLHTALDTLHSQGYTTAALWVLGSNIRAMEFYRAQGFRDTGITQGSGPLLERKMEIHLPAQH